MERDVIVLTLDAKKTIKNYYNAVYVVPCNDENGYFDDVLCVEDEFYLKNKQAFQELVDTVNESRLERGNPIPIPVMRYYEMNVAHCVRNIKELTEVLFCMVNDELVHHIKGLRGAAPLDLFN